MDTLLAIVNELDAEALRQKNYYYQGLAKRIRMSAHKNRSEFSEIIRLAPDELNFLANHDIWDLFYTMYQSYIASYLETGSYGKALEEVQRMYSMAQRHSHDYGKGESLLAMSAVYGKMLRFEEEEKCIRECVEVVKNLAGFENLKESAYFRLCYVLTRMERFEEALKETQEFEKIIYRHEEAYQVKRTMSWINLWRIYTMLYAGIQDFDKLEIYCNKIDSVGVPAFIQPEFYAMRARLFHSRNNDAKALEMLDKAEDVFY